MADLSFVALFPIISSILLKRPGGLSWAEHPSGGQVACPSPQWLAMFCRHCQRSIFHPLRCLNWGWPTLPHWPLISHRYTWSVPFDCTNGADWEEPCQATGNGEVIQGRLIQGSIGMQMWPAAWPLHYKRNNSSLGRTVQLPPLVSFCRLHKRQT